MEQLLVTEANGDLLGIDTDAAATAGRCCGLPPGLRLAPAEASRHADRLKALGHTVRLQIVDLLARYGGQVCVCDIEGQFTLSQPTISHHLRILRQAGLVDGEQRGLWIYYRLHPQTLVDLEQLIGSWRSSCEEG